MYDKAIVAGLFSMLVASAPGAALAATGTVAMTVVDEQGHPFKDALIMFAMVDDPTQTFTIGENDAGAYADTVQLPRKETTWRITRVVATGYLPMQISATVTSPSETVQQVPETELNPGIPIPEIQILDGGTTEIRLQLGPRSVVMARFAQTREKPDAEETEAAPATDSAYANALRLYGAGDVDGSLPFFEQAIAEEPANAELRVTYANVLYKAKRFDAFEKAAREAFAVAPGNGEMMMMIYSSARSRGDMKTALDALLTLKQAGLGGTDLLQHLDYVAQKMGPSSDAIPAYLAILDLDHDNADACVNLAFLYSAKGDAASCDRYLAKAVELAPRRAPTIYLDMGSKLVGAKDVKPAQLERGVTMLRKAIELDASLAPAYKRLGLALWKQEDWTGTRQAFEKYLELSPDAPDRDDIQDYLSRLPE